MNLYEVIQRPLVTEKGVTKKDNERTLCFQVHADANKTQVKIAIEQIFGVKVDRVNTANRQGKRKRTRAGYGQRKATKRALVTLRAGETIDIFGGPGA